MRLQLRGLVTGYGGAAVLRGVDLDVERGEFLCVLGSSGSGKTTLLRTVAGLHPLSAGRVLLGERDLAGVRPERRRVGLVPQEGALFAHLDVAGNVAFGLPRHRGERAARRARVAELLALVGLEGFGDRMPHELSGGQRQRVALSRALAPRPDIVLLDEPFSGLDAALRAEVRAQVADVLRGAGTTTVLITHDQQEALSVGERVAVLHEGRVEQVDRPHALYSHPASEWVARFVGDATLLPGHRCGTRVHTQLGALPCRDEGPAGAVTAVLRPEQVQLHAPTGADPGVTATVCAVEFLGAAQRVHLDAVGTLRVVAQVEPHVVWRRGDRAELRVSRPVHVVPVR